MRNPRPILILLAALALGAPTPAHAGCGDGDPIVHAASAEWTDAAHRLPLGGKASQPCSGPMCKQRASLPLSAPTVPAPKPSFGDAGLTALFCWMNPALDSRVWEIVSLHPIGRVTEVFHPPRRLG